MPENAPLHQFSRLDYVVIVGYLMVLMSIGFVLKRLCRNVKDYFIGGNKVAWWLAGASCFMMSFSAWTFTGAAGFAYKKGVLVIPLFLINVVSFAFAARFVAARCRQTRCITFLQIVRERFGPVSEQVITWMQVPMMMIGGAVWLTGLATFVSAAFGVPMPVTIIISGVAIGVYSTLGGSWGVMSTDFLQSLLLFALTLVVAVLTVSDCGGATALVRQIPADRLTLFDSEHTPLWLFAYGCHLFLGFNSITGAPRFLSVKDGRSASKAAWLAAVLFLLGPVIWFIPPLAATFVYPDLQAVLPGLANPQDAAYAVMGLRVLPPGLAGLLVMVIFAATLSSMDTAVNQNAAIICMNMYKPLFRPKAGEREMFVVAHLVNIGLTLSIIFLALVFAVHSRMPLFDLFLTFAANVVVPLSVPFFLIYWVRRAPPAAALLATVAGFGFNLFRYLAQRAEGDWPLLDQLVTWGVIRFDPYQEWPLSVGILGVVVLSGGTFLLTTLFWSRTSPGVQRRIAAFYEKMETPIDVETEVVGSEDARQMGIVGGLALILGVGVLLLAWSAQRPRDLWAIVAVGGIVAGFGTLLLTAARRITRRQGESGSSESAPEQDMPASMSLGCQEE